MQPTGHWRRHLRDAIVVALFVAYPILAHLVAAAPPTAHLGVVAFAVAPLVAALALVGGHAGWRIATLLACTGCGVLLVLYSEVVGRNLGLVYFIQTTCTNAALAIVFGRTLKASREPLCTRFARMVRGPLDPPVARYTRQVTLAWTIFFVAMLLVSIVLYALAPIGVWSTFANLLTMPLVALMFIVEYAIRIRTFPDLPHKPILASLRAYRNSPGAKAAPPR
jgi:uncharacterized membrane protein